MRLFSFRLQILLLQPSHLHMYMSTPHPKQNPQDVSSLYSPKDFVHVHTSKRGVNDRIFLALTD